MALCSFAHTWVGEIAIGGVGGEGEQSRRVWWSVADGVDHLDTCIIGGKRARVSKRARRLLTFMSRMLWMYSDSSRQTTSRWKVVFVRGSREQSRQREGFVEGNERTVTRGIYGMA